MVHITKAIKDTIEKSTLDELREFVKVAGKSAVWYLVSDYCFDDDTKVSDTVTFSLILNHDKLENIKEYINAFQPCDIKSTTEVREGFLKYLVSPIIYNFSFVLNKADRFLANSLQNDEIDDFMEHINSDIQNWVLDNAKAAEYIQDLKKRITLFKEQKKAKSFNWKLVRKIFIISSIASVIIYVISKLNNAIAIKWISDRDGIAEKFDSITIDLAFISYVYQLSDFGSVPVVDLTSAPQLFFVTSKKGTEDDYEELVRIPDFIAGTVASIKKADYEFCNFKYYPVFFGTIVNSNNHTIIAIDDQNNDFFIRRMLFKVSDLNETKKWEFISTLISDNTISKQINKGMNKAEHVNYIVHKDDILACDFTGIKDIIDRLSLNLNTLIENRGCLEVFIAGFDEDSREVYAIPEIRKWYSESLIAGVPWFFFLSNDGMSLSILLFSCCEIVMNKNQEGIAYAEIAKHEDISLWLNQNFENLNKFIEDNNIPDKYNEEMSRQVLAIVNGLLIGRGEGGNP